MNQRTKPRRVKIVSLDQNLMIGMLNWWRNPPGWIALPVCDELPEDAEVVSLHANWEMRTIEAMVYHESFPELLHGMVPERIPGLFTDFRTVPFERAAEREQTGCRKCQGTGQEYRHWNGDYIDCNACNGRGN